MQAIVAKLVNISIENTESKYFIPFAELDQFLNAEVIEKAIHESGLQVHLWKEVIHTVLEGGKRVFAILIQIGALKAIIKLIEHDHLQVHGLDAKLPFNENEIVKLLEETHGRLFYRTQWSFIAPLFRGDLSHRVLDQKTILPFINDRKIGEGAQGEVFSVAIDPRHQSDPAAANLPLNLKLVRKEKRLSSSESSSSHPTILADFFDQEGHVLSLLRLIRHPCIVRLIGSYTFRNTYNLLFEEAEGNLEGLLSKTYRPPAFETDDSLFQAMQGLCEAIASFHRFTQPSYGIELKGYHHDLKPDNILVSGSRFLLSDFGLSSLKDKTARSKTTSKEVRGYYVSPESEDAESGFVPKMVGQPSDVWALGCILAVILTYVRHGSSGVEEFEQKRKHRLKGWTMYTFHQSGGSSQAVKEWLLKLKTHTTPEVSSLVQLIRDILRIDPNERLDAHTVSMSMKFIAAKSTYQRTEEKLKGLHNHLQDSALILEEKRLKLFSQTLGLDNDEHKWPGFPEKPSGLVDFIEVRELLLNVQQAVDLVSKQTLRAPFLAPIYDSIDNLWNVLPLVAKSQLQTTLEAEIMETVDLRLLDSVQDRFKHQTPHRNVGLLAAMKLMLLLADQKKLATTQEDINLELDKKLIDESGPKIGPFSDLAKLNDPVTGKARKVLVEWLEYDEKWQEEIGKELFSRIRAIAKILHKKEKPDGFRSLHCLKFYHSSSRHSFGLVFDISTSVDSKGDTEDDVPVSLVDMMVSTRKQQRRPDLGKLYQLTTILAKAVSEWHKTGWIHRRISSFSILFINSKNSDIFTSILNPAFIGFQFSRPSTQDAFTSGAPTDKRLQDYCHPKYLRGDERHLPEFDYYSLGLVLLEIGFWKPLSQLVKDFTEEDQSPENLKCWILENLVQKLHMLMGSTYQNVVHACLTFHSDEATIKSFVVSHNVLDQFESEVVQKLGLCHA